MYTLEEWFDEYGKSHRNSTNKAIHWVCVPVILFSILGIFWLVSSSLTIALVFLCCLFYWRLSVRLAIAMTVTMLAMLMLVSIIESVALPIVLTLFVLAWIGQFIGHHIEGKKTSFFQDLQFLLIGPLWVVAFLFRKFNITY